VRFSIDTGTSCTTIIDKDVERLRIGYNGLKSEETRSRRSHKYYTPNYWYLFWGKVKCEICGMTIQGGSRKLKDHKRQNHSY
jgi:hypothetical protein